MLVLSRKPGEHIKVGDVIFTIVKIRGGSVRVGIDAPQEMHILRGELEEHPDATEQQIATTQKENS
jgi:carbon storage regulator